MDASWDTSLHPSKSEAFSFETKESINFKCAFNAQNSHK